MARNQQLVCAQLENIDRTALEKYQHLIRKYIRGRNGIYALYRRDKLYYVGLAKNLRSRLKAHLRDRHHRLWDRFSVYLTIGTGFIKEMESLLLRIGKVPGNKQKGRFARCHDLQRTFARDIRTEQREQLDEIFGRAKRVQADDKHAGKRRPVLALYFSKSVKLVGRHKGIHAVAHVRSNGTIRFKKRVFNSPSLAASAATGYPINGWWFWTYERAPGDWVRLREVRNT